MTSPRSNRKRKPTFLWQALLIVLPVAVLAVFGFFSLRQDRVLAQHEAAERAQAIADDLLSKCWAMIIAAKPIERNSFQVDRNGQLIFPAPYSPTPIPRPFNPAELSPAQERLWQAAQRAEAGPSGFAATAGNYRDFIASDPPATFAAVAHYGLALALANQGMPQAAAEMFDLVAEKYPEAVGESGLPLQPLAQVKLLGLARLVTNGIAPASFASIDSFCSNAVHRPTPLTPYLLDLCSQEASVRGIKNDAQRWQRVWQADESRRQLFAAARPYLPKGWAIHDESLPRLFWFTAPVMWRQVVTNWSGIKPNSAMILYPLQIQGSNWLAVRLAAPTNDVFACRTEPEAGSELASIVNYAPPVPPYFGVDVVLAGKTLPALNRDLRVWRLVHYNGKGSGEKKYYTTDLATTILASATKTEAGADLLKVTIYLTSPATLFKLQTARTFWFGSLILFSAFAALLGLLAAWRSFHRQLQLSEMKSNFVASVSHELRAPIASVRLMAESLERGKIAEPARQNEYFRFIGQESRRLSSLIENVLDFSRIEQGRKQYEFEPTDLCALVQQTVKIMEPYAAERQVNLKLAEGAGVQALACSDRLDPNNLQPATGNLQPSLDGRAIQQALVNLLDNAIKHSPKGATVTVGLEIQNPESRIQNPVSVTLYVEDSGPGIPPEEHEKIFERFYRLGSELRRETQGVGIGLSIVKHIVEAHGGRVVVRSAPGQGSRFTIELPVLPTPKNDE